MSKGNIYMKTPEKKYNENMAMCFGRCCVALVVLLCLLRGNVAVPKKCINTPFDLVIASEDTNRVNPDAVAEINRVWKAIAAQLDIGGQHRIGYITITDAAAITNFALGDHTTLAALNTAFDAVGDQSANAANAVFPDGVMAIRTQVADNMRVGVAKLGLVLGASLLNNAALATQSQLNADDGIIMYAIGVGTPVGTLNRAVSTIVRHPPNDRYRRALTLRNFNFFRDNVLEDPIIRLLCPGDLGGSCGRNTACDQAANTVCVQGTCKCNPGLQNDEGVCVTGGVIGEACNIGECSVANSVCELRVCTCMEGFTAEGTTVCEDNGDDLRIDRDIRVAATLFAALPFFAYSINLQNPSTLALVARR